MIFLRHPEPDVPPGTCYGRTDLDITEAGREQIALAVEATPPLSRIVASPALRCRSLAEALAERDGIMPVFDERLWEMHMGDWEGLPWRDIPPEVASHWMKDPVTIKVPGGECFADLQLRVGAAIGELLDGDIHQTAIVCHAGPIRAVQMLWQGLSFREAFAEAPSYATPIRLLPPSDPR